MTQEFEYKTSSVARVGTSSNGVNLDEAQGIVECFVAGIGNKDSVGDIVASGAFTKSLQRRKPRVVWGHNWNDPIGKVLEIYEVPSTDPRLPLKMKVAGIGGLFARVQFNLNSEKGKEAFANVAFFGEEQEWSIGYKTLRAQYDQKSQANVIYELELYEVSPVLHGANQLTGTISVKADDTAVMDTLMGPNAQMNIDREEMEKQLSLMMGGKVSVVEIEDQDVTFAKFDDNGGYKKYKCGYARGNRGFMFGMPEPVMPISGPSRMPMAGPGMPSGMPVNEPRRVVRPSQMPSIPVAVKPGENGIVMVALPPVEYENDTEVKPIDKNDLDKEEADLRDALRKIVKRHGKLDEDGDGIWAGYYPPEKNPVAGIGVKCANCVFYKGGTSCEIIAMEVHPEGKCRFAVIPNGVVKGDVADKKDIDTESDFEMDQFLKDMEEKYPGELLLAGFRGILSRRKRRRRKWKNLAEYDDQEAPMEKGYVIPVHPTDAFYVKKELDPILEYHNVESFVDEDGIVITAGITYDFIDAVDNALENIKKKSLDSSSTEVKAIGRRLGSYAASRLIDRPRLGRSRGRLSSGDATGGLPGDIDPNLVSLVDFDRDGWAREGTRKPVWVGLGSGADKPSIDKPNIPDANKDSDNWSRLSGVLDEKNRNKVTNQLLEFYKNGKANEYVAPNKRENATSRALSSGNADLFFDQTTLKKDVKSFQKGQHNGREVDRHVSPDYKRFGMSTDELEARRKHEAVADQWNKEGAGWMTVPWTQIDMYHSPDYLRGRELGYNQARLKWNGDVKQRPKEFNEKQKAGVYYAQWYYSFVADVGSYLKAFGDGRDGDDFWRGVTDAIHDSVYTKRPDTGEWPKEHREALSDWKKSYGFDPGSPMDPKRRKNQTGSLSSGRSRGTGGQRIFSDDTVDRILRGDERVWFDSDNVYGEDNTPIDQGFDVYERIIEDFLGPEGKRQMSQVKPGNRANKPTEQGMSDEQIYNERMAGASLADMAEKLNISREEVRQRELRHMRKMRSGKKEPQALSSGKISNDYKKFLAKPKSQRTAEELSRFNGSAYIFRSGEVLSSGADVKPEELETNKARLDRMYEDLTTKVLAALEEAIKNPGRPWEIPWRTNNTDLYARNLTRMPQRGGRVYEGLNQLLLSLISRERGHEVNRWAGKVQWQRAGGKLKPGAEGVNIWAPVAIQDATGKFIRNDYKVVTVYHVNDVLGLPERFYKPTPKTETLSDQERLKIADDVVKEINPEILHGNFGGAFYRPSTDKIHMPPFEDFKSAVQYYGTLLHEMVHWTGHPSRTGRPKGGRINAPDGSPEKIAYAKEELVAEIGAAFVMGILGLEPQVREDHAQYLASWMKALQTEPNALRTALDRAQEAVDWLMARSKTMRDAAGYDPNERKNIKQGKKAFVPMLEGFEDAPEIPVGGAIRGPLEDLIDADNEVGEISSGRRAARRTTGYSFRQGEISDNKNWRPIRDEDGRSDYDKTEDAVSFDDNGSVLDHAGRSLSSGRDEVAITPTSRAKEKAAGKHKGKKAKNLKRSPSNMSHAMAYHLDYEPTEQQKDVVDAVTQVVRKQNEDGSFVVTINAGAGTGKTTTLRAVSRALMLEFSLDDKFGRPLPDDQRRAKLKQIGDKYYPEGKAPDWSAMTPEEVKSELKKLEKKYPANNVYYIVFNRKNQEEAEVTFDSNTGVATLSKLAYWSLRNGSGNTKYAGDDPVKIEKFLRKMDLARPDTRGGNFRRDKDYSETAWDGSTVTVKGRKPRAEELGYSRISGNVETIVDYFIAEHSDLWSRAFSDPDGRLDVGHVRDPLNPTTKIDPTRRERALPENVALMLKNALVRWSLSPEEEANKSHFILTQSQREGDASATAARIRQRRGNVQLGDAMFAEEDIPDVAVEMLQALINDIKDPDSKLLPPTDTWEKLWAMTDPDLRTDPGLVSHAKNGVVENKTIPKLGPDGKPVKLGSVYIDEQGREWVITAIKNTTKSGYAVNLRKRFASDDKPLSAFFIDEAQDMNPLMRSVIEKNRDRLPIVMVGDEAQGVYNFRNAENLMKTVGGDYELDITESFRYGDRLAYAGNVILARRGAYLRAMGEEDRFKHVVGAATDVIENNFNLNTAKTPQARADKLLRIQGKYIDPRNKKNNQNVNLLELDKSEDKTELNRILSEVMNEELGASRGMFVGNMENPEAIITATNRGVFQAALAFALEFTSRPDNRGKSPIISIPAKKHEDLLAFYKHLWWITGDGQSKGIPRPPESSWIGNIWTTGQLAAHMQRRAGTQARAAYLIHQSGIPGTTWDGRQIPLPALIRILAGDFRDKDNPVDAIIRPERPLFRLFTPFDVVGGDLVERSERKKASAGSAGARGDNQLQKWDIIPAGDKKQENYVYAQLQMEGTYGVDFGGAKKLGGGKDVPGKWTGNIIITGAGVDELRGRGSDPKFPNSPGNKTGVFRDDVEKIIKQLGLEDKIKPIKNASIDKEGAKRPPHSGFIILGSPDKPEESAALLQLLGRELRKRAEKPGGDIEVTTAQLAKGREWDRVKIAEDFSRPEEKLPLKVLEAAIERGWDPDPDAPSDPRIIFEVLSEMSPEERGQSINAYVEALNAAYVVVTRAKQQIDLGNAFARIYFNKNAFDLGNAEIGRGIEAKRIPQRVAPPTDIPMSGDFIGSDQEKPTGGKINPTIFDVPGDYVPDLEGEKKEKKKGRPKKGEVRPVIADDEEEGDDELPETDETPDDDEGGLIEELDEKDELEDDAVDKTLSSGRSKYANYVENFAESTSNAVAERDIYAFRGFNSYADAELRSLRQSGSRVGFASAAEQAFAENADETLQVNDDFEFASDEDAAKFNAIIDSYGKSKNIEWAMSKDIDDLATDNEKAVARKILNSPESLSSGRSERRTYRTLEDVRGKMQYDWEAAGFRFVPTEEQQNVSDAIMTGEDVIVRALAGTGKTSTLELVAQRISKQDPDKKILYLVFNTKNKEEAEKKFAKFGNVEVRTWDSVAYRQIVGNNKRMKDKLDFNTDGLVFYNDYRAIANKYDLKPVMSPSNGEQIDGFRLARVVSKALDIFATSGDKEISGRHIAEAAGINSVDVPANEFRNLVNTAKQMWLDAQDEKSDMQLNRSWLVKLMSLSDPDLSAGKGMDKHTDGNDILFFDEAQDANPVMSQMVRAQKLQKVIVGDSNQAIYEFRGAKDELDEFKAKYELTLTESFRFNQAIAGFANRFLKIHQDKKEKDGNVVPSSRLRLAGRGPAGQIMSMTDVPGYPGILDAKNRQMKKNGERESFAFLSATNAAAFKFILSQQEAGRKTGSVKTFKQDLTDMVNHAEWLYFGKKTPKPKSRFGAFNEFADWKELALAADPNSNSPSKNNIQAVTAYKLMAERGFDFAELRSAIDKIETVDAGGEARKTKVTAEEISPNNIIPVIGNGIMNVTVGDGVLKLNFSDRSQFQEFMSRKPIFAGKLGFKFDGASKTWQKQFRSQDEAAEIVNELARISAEGLRAESGASSPFSNPTEIGKAIAGSGSLDGFFAEIGSKKSGIKFNKKPDGSIRMDIVGDTYPIIGKDGPMKTKFKDTRLWRWDKDAKSWYTEASSEADAMDRLSKTRSAMGIVDSGSGTDGGWIVPPAVSEEDRPQIDVVAQTAHRSKGLEFDYVQLGEDFAVPKPPENPGDRTPEEIRQMAIDQIGEEQVRLQYVAATRAMKVLDPGALSWIYDYTNATDEDYKAPVNSLSSGGKKNRRNRRRAKWSDEDRQNFADRNILKPRTVPKKRKEGPTAEEFSSGATAAEPSNSGSRMDRRLRRISAATQQLSSGNYSEKTNTAKLAGISNDEADVEFAMRFWDGFKSRGISLESDSDTQSPAVKARQTVDSLRKVGERMRSRAASNQDGTNISTVGDITKNDPMAENSSSTWMLSVSKLREAIRVPSEYEKRDGKLVATQTRPISAAELGIALGIEPYELRDQRISLDSENAGLSHETVRLLIAEIGNQPEFSNWRLFSPPTDDEPRMTEMTEGARFAENLARGAMRDRFITETFGKDAYPFWYDRAEREVISADEYVSLGEVDRQAKFMARGRFNARSERSSDGESFAEVDLTIQGLGGDDAIPEPRQTASEPVDSRTTKARREEFQLNELLEALGIERDSNWSSSLRAMMQEAFGTDDVGLTERNQSAVWEKNGVPIAYINEMVRTGMIPSAADVFKTSGEKLDKELAANNHSVSEALFSFLRQNYPDSPLNGKKTRDRILGIVNSEQTLDRATTRFRTSGTNFAKLKGDEPRFSQSELQDVVNRFNEIFGTSHTVEDIFSAEQLREARRRIEVEHQPTKPSSKVRKNKNR